MPIVVPPGAGVAVAFNLTGRLIMNDGITPVVGATVLIRPNTPAMPDPAGNNVYVEDVDVETDGDGEFSTPLVGLDDVYYTVMSGDSRTDFRAGPFAAPLDGATVDLADIIALVPSPILPLDATALRLEFAAEDAAIRGEFSAADAALEAELRAEFITGAVLLTPSQFGSLGVGNDSAVLQDWFDEVVGLGANGFLPPGDYILNDPITGTNLGPNKFAITGNGVGVSRLIVPASNTVGGIILDATNTPRDAEVLFRDFEICTQGQGQGTGLQFTMSNGGATHQRSVTVQNVKVYGEDINEDCFDIGINLAGNYRPYLENVTVTGPWGPGVSGDTTDASPQYVPTVALVLDDSYEWYVNACHLWSAHTLLRDVGTNAEAGRIANSQLVSGRVGIERTRTGREPHFQVENCHINARDSALQVNGSKIIFVRGCHFYNTDDTDEFNPGVARDIYLKNSEMVVIADNVFHFDGATDRVHIHLDSTTYGQRVTIANNVFNSVATNAVLIGTAADNVTLLGNQYTGTYVKRVVDNSGKAVIFDSVAGNWRMSNHNVGAGSGPVHQLMRNSVSPAASDLLGRLSMLGKDSADNDTEYTAIQTVLLDPTDTTEGAALALWGQVSGTLTRLAQFQDVGSGAVDTTAMWVYLKRAGTTGFERVLLGAVDSGGTGYRMLRVPNS